MREQRIIRTKHLWYANHRVYHRSTGILLGCVFTVPNQPRPFMREWREIADRVCKDIAAEARELERQKREGRAK